MKLPTCTTHAEVIAAYGQVCAVVGTYDVQSFNITKKGTRLREWPVVVLADGSVLIESLWDETKFPSAETIARYRGRRVEVVGKLHGAPPLPEGRAANLSLPTVSPVDSIRILAE